MASNPAAAAGGSVDVDKEMAIVMEELRARDPDQPEFLQAAHEMITSLKPLFESDPRLLVAFRALAEPDRIVQFRVPYEDGDGKMRYTRGFRVQATQALGPYKGGLRFHPSVNMSIVKFLALEQSFKNALTGLPLGAGKGGAAIDTRGMTDEQVRNFCQSFMTELQRHIGPDTDVPAGDIGVGGREIGFLFGQYKRITATHSGTITGKGAGWGGSLMRPEATGFGVAYFAVSALATAGLIGGADGGPLHSGNMTLLEAGAKPLAGKRCAISGSGNVALFLAQKLMELGATVLTLSDSKGFVHASAGITPEQLAWVHDLKFKRRGRISEFAHQFEGVTFHEGQRPWGIECDVAFPAATQNEVELADAQALVGNKCQALFEAANMPTTPEAAAELEKAGVLLGPAKAVNAGGVAVSGLEMAQNSGRVYWTSERVDEELKTIMVDIHQKCVEAAERFGQPTRNLSAGANLAAAEQVLRAIVEQGYA